MRIGDEVEVQVARRTIKGIVVGIRAPKVLVGARDLEVDRDSTGSKLTKLDLTVDGGNGVQLLLTGVPHFSSQAEAEKFGTKFSALSWG